MKIPLEIVSELEKCMEDLPFGRANLEIKIHDHRPQYRIVVEKSLVPGRCTSGMEAGDEPKK